MDSQLKNLEAKLAPLWPPTPENIPSIAQKVVDAICYPPNHIAIIGWQDPSYRAIQKRNLSLPTIEAILLVGTLLGTPEDSFQQFFEKLAAKLKEVNLLTGTDL